MTLAPAQVIVDGTVIITEGVTGGETDMLTVLDDTVSGEAQIALVVMVTVIKSPFVKVVVE